MSQEPVLLILGGCLFHLQHRWEIHLEIALVSLILIFLIGCNAPTSFSWCSELLLPPCLPPLPLRACPARRYSPPRFLPPPPCSLFQSECNLPHTHLSSYSRDSVLSLVNSPLLFFNFPTSLILLILKLKSNENSTSVKAPHELKLLTLFSLALFR